LSARAAPDSAPAPRLRICIAYDRLYPWSIGGAERWYRLLGEQLANQGHQVTYVTSRHWPAGDDPEIGGVRVVTVSSSRQLYARGRRSVSPVFRFGTGLWCHLLAHGAAYDVVHTSAALSWAALGAAALAPLHRYRLVLDWWEVWTAAYWRSYAGRVAGSFGWLLQRIVARVRQEPIAYSELHARRLRALRMRGEIPVIRGLLPAMVGVRAAVARGVLPSPPDPPPRPQGTRHPAQCAGRGGTVGGDEQERVSEQWGLERLAAQTPRPAEALVVFAGRHIPEKQVAALVPALALARERWPELRATIFGGGPDFGLVRAAVEEAGLAEAVDLPGFVADDVLVETLRRALCVVHLSRREGFGLVVAEAAALGVPSVVLRHPDSAASELIVEGVNGITVGNANPDEIASAILHIRDAGNALRLSTLAWFRANRGELAIEGSLPRMLTIYRGEAERGRSGA
jgi:glycosyltransferase involved in cell wall biosynthesis